ncbi:hypothetical protein ABK040_010459 [Willaertia magna]
MSLTSKMLSSKNLDLGQSLLGTTSASPVNFDDDNLVVNTNLPSASTQAATFGASTKDTVLGKSYKFLKENVLPKQIKEDDLVEQSIIEKFLKYRIFPTKLVVEILQVVFCFIFVYFYIQEYKNFKADVYYTLQNTFLPKDFESIQSNPEGIATFYIFNVDDLKENVKGVVDKFYAFPEKSVSVFFAPDPIVKMSAKLMTKNPRVLLSNETRYDSDPSIIDWRYISRERIKSIFLSESYYVNETLDKDNVYGSLLDETGDELKYVVDRLEELDLKFSYINLDTSVSGFPNCYLWKVDIKFLFAGGGRVPMQIMLSYDNCIANDNDYYASLFQKPRGYIGIILCILSFISFVFYLKSFITRIRVFIKQRRRDRRITFASFFVKYLGIWLPVSLAKDIFLIVGLFAMLVRVVKYEQNVDTFSQTLLALGALLCATALAKYFNYQAKFYLAIRAFTSAIPNIIKYVLSILPVFIGFVLAGTCWFGFYTYYFYNIDASMVTLFSAMNGDNIRIIFDKVYGFNDFYRFLSRVYLVVYLLLFICTILNIFLSIMEESYSAVLSHISEAGGEEQAVKQLKREEDKVKRINTMSSSSLNLEEGDSDETEKEEDEDDSKKENEEKQEEENTVQEKGENLLITTLKNAIEFKLKQQQFGKLPNKQVKQLQNISDKAKRLLQLLEQ